jgi:hypothetical protein
MSIYLSLTKIFQVTTVACVCVCKYSRLCVIVIELLTKFSARDWLMRQFCTHKLQCLSLVNYINYIIIII